MEKKKESVFDTENLKIKILPKNQSKLIANVNIAINTVEFGFITIKGFQIWKSNLMNERLQEKINIAPPSLRMYGRYISFVHVEDKKMWLELEHLIYSAYLRFSSVNKVKSKEDEKVNPDNIPF